MVVGLVMLVSLAPSVWVVVRPLDSSCVRPLGVVLILSLDFSLKFNPAALTFRLLGAIMSLARLLCLSPLIVGLFALIHGHLLETFAQ